MLLDTRNKNIHGLGVGISTIFQIFGHFLYQKGTGSLRMVINFTPSSATNDTINENVYGLWVGISTVFQIFGHFLFKGRWDHPKWS
jgi:CRISPR/Cas system CMR-associated protein Cmr3 (group 5 of RAMP superfamily)